jgi:uncharacterized protein (DUF427 family)
MQLQKLGVVAEAITLFIEASQPRQELLVPPSQVTHCTWQGKHEYCIPLS